MTPIRCTLTLMLALAAGTATAHDSPRPAKPAQPATATATATTPAAAPAARPSTPERGRDWTLIDTNKDGYISPDEMDTWLKANPGPQR